MTSKYQIRIQLNETRGRPRKNLSDDKKAWLIEVLGRSDLTYTNPSCADNVYIRKIDGERQYFPRQYLLWSLKDLHDILNGTSASIGQAPPISKLRFQKSSPLANCMILSKIISNTYTTRTFHTLSVFVTHARTPFC